jgi:Cu/Ag efflux protein CusF
MRAKFLAAAAAALLFSTVQANAQSTGGMGGGGMDHGGMMGGQGGMMAQPGNAMADGEVRKVDKDAGKLTIKHGPIPSMDMPPMTMVYRVKDPAMLDQVKAGDKIRFDAEKVGGAFTVTRIEPAK